MELTLNNGFCELSDSEVFDVNGGMAPAAIYALGFAMGMTPAGALAVCGVAAAVGIGLAFAR